MRRAVRAHRVVDPHSAHVDASLTQTRQRERRRVAASAALQRFDDASTMHLCHKRHAAPDDVLVGQLDHLALMAERPNVVVQVLPLDAPAQPTYWGALVMLGFPWSGGLVYLEHRGGAHYLDSPHDIEIHCTAFDRLRDVALSPAESMRRITDRARELTT
ncbi:MAG TPA: Scr1 family TA system antitoxin-like transcriptional regulator [Acidimicrobiales bacterium]|nr:Scr1 family TA system antitoxin-like transcriptional regulator [Acidimicrobiales bacterium]